MRYKMWCVLLLCGCLASESFTQHSNITSEAAQEKWETGRSLAFRSSPFSEMSSAIDRVFGLSMNERSSSLARSYPAPKKQKSKGSYYSPPRPRPHHHHTSHNCDFVFTAAHFDVRSPNYPNYYFPNQHCRYTVQKLPNMCLVEFQIRDLALENSPLCDYDYVQLGGQRICGRRNPYTVTLPFYGAELVWFFHSDDAVADRGFWVTGQQIPCAPPAPVYPTYPIPNTYRGFQPSYGVPAIPARPSYRQPQPIVAPTTPRPVTFHPSPPPTYYPPPTTTQRPLTTFVPTYPPPTSPRPTYSPPTTTYKPTYPTYPTTSQPIPPAPRTCSFVFRSPRGQFQSLGYPAGYPNALNCAYRFETLPGFCTLELQFSDFQVEETIGCVKDALIIGGSRYCGTSLAQQSVKIAFPFGASVDVKFVTDGDITRRGFRASFRLLECPIPPPVPTTLPPIPPTPSTTLPPITTPVGVTCDRSFRDQENFIVSVNYPKTYVPNLDCVYTIEKFDPRVRELEITFLAFELQNSPNCLADFFDSGLQRYCGVQTGLIFKVPFDGPLYEMRFHSDIREQYKGFNIKVVQVIPTPTTPIPIPTTQPAPVTCAPLSFNSPTFTFSSPQYPASYRPHQECRYTVIKASRDVCMVELNFKLFSLPQTPNCEGDFLSVDGTKYCGARSGYRQRYFFDEESPSMEIIFRSDKADQGNPGFFIEAIQITDCSPIPDNITPAFRLTKENTCDLTFDSEYGEVESPVGRLTTGKEATECRYKFKQILGYCGVRLAMDKFYVAPSANCSKSFIELEERMFCGQQLDKSTIDIGYVINKEYLTIPYRVIPDAKVIWNFTYSPLACDPAFRYQCASSLWTKTGTLEYKAETPLNAQCDFVIRRWSRRISKVQIDFETFDLTDSKGCSANYVALGGHRMCGQMSHKTVLLDFPRDEEAIRLPLQHYENAASIKLNIQQI